MVLNIYQDLGYGPFTAEIKPNIYILCIMKKIIFLMDIFGLYL